MQTTTTTERNQSLLVKILAGVIVVLLAYIVFNHKSSATPSGAMERTYGGDVIAKVNGKDIREEEIRERLDFITGGKGASINFNNIDEKGLEALAREVYVQRLVLDEALKSDIKNDKDLKNKIASLVNTIYKEKFLEGIAKKNITDEKVKKTYDDLVAKAKVSKQYKVKHILLKSEAEASEAKGKITGGSASFEDIAKLDSMDKASATKGGDLGYVFPEEYVKEFAEAVKKAPQGQVVGPVKTEFGYHLIKVEDSKPAEIVPFEEAKPRIEKQLGSEAVKAYVDTISKDLKIEVVKKPNPAAATPAAPAGAAKGAAKPAAAPATPDTTPAAAPADSSAPATDKE